MDDKKFEYEYIYKYFLARLDILHKIWLGGFAFGALSLTFISHGNLFALLGGSISLLGCLWGVQWNLEVINKLFIYLRFMDDDVGIRYHKLQKGNAYLKKQSHLSNKTVRYILLVPYIGIFVTIIGSSLFLLLKEDYSVLTYIIYAISLTVLLLLFSWVSKKLLDSNSVNFFEIVRCNLKSSMERIDKNNK